MRFTLRQLQVFIAAANHQNLTRAADELAMSQSAASSALKDLEDRYNVLLFDRIGKRLQLNEQGLLIRAKAEALLAQAQELEQALLNHDEIGSLSVGATLSIGNYLAVKLVADYMAKHPHAQIHLDVANTARIVEKVLSYEIDVGLIEGEVNHPDLDTRFWRHDELAIFCPPHHPLVSKQQQQGHIDEEDLLSQPWIMREPGSGTRQAFERALHNLLPKLHVALELQHTEAIKRAVEAGLGIGCLSLITLEDAFKRGSLVQLKLPHYDLGRSLYLIVHRQKYRSAGIMAWLDIVLGS